MKTSKNTLQPEDAELQKQLVSLGFPNLPVTETTRAILLNKLYKSSKKNESFKTDPFWETLVRQNMSACSPEDETSGTRYSTDDIKLSSKTSCEHNSTIRLDKIYETTLLSLNRGKVMDKIYLTNADYAIRSSPDTNASLSSCTEQQSHLGVVNRLLSFRDRTFRKHNNCANQAKTASSFSQKSDKFFTNSKRTLYELMSYISAQSRLNQSFKPYLLVLTFIGFFLGLAFIYMWRNPNNMYIADIERQIKVCDATIPIKDCVPADYVDSTIRLLKNMFKVLQISTKEEYCSNKKIIISETEFIKYVKKIEYNTITISKINLTYAKMLIEQNPQWKISIFYGEDINYSLSTARSSLFCTFYKKIQSFFIIIGIGAIIGICSGICYTIYRYVRAWRVNRSHIIQQFTTDVVNELIYTASLSETPKEREVIITHMRDKLIPLNKRKTYLKFWNEALHILETTDSRIQFGVRILDGEEYRTMKWMGNANYNTSAKGLFKKWQSPAFDYANKIVNPPTSCLKIRHMFDSTEANISNLKQIIEAALLEKVGIRCGIRDIQIDKQTCCVYVRCNSEVDAGIIHNEINGWWFDKRLISIKFLRLQRYLARFPNKNH
ncbi:inner nuclear membrane protein Man1 [Eurosta solidaginis]|uniref:inner nuclear membrane protein Man1 n=1 Tax=Eurosta solidaginis TaxID=178769 RepID=UPI0035316B3C